MASSYQDQYRQNQILTATPQQLVLMLYDRALRDLRQAAEAILADNLKEANTKLQHVEDILNELLLSIDPDLPPAEGGEIAVNLGRMYDFYIVRTREANITKDIAIIQELQKQIGDLRSTWAEAMVKAAKESKGGGE